MSPQLSKLHVRFIQTQESFYLLKGENSKSTKLPFSQLYIKDNNNFYLINQNTPIEKGQTLTLTFKEPTPALNTLTCKVSTQEMQNGSEEHEDALLFFNAEPQDVRQLLLLTIQEIQ